MKKLVLEADATGFQDPEMGGWEQWKHLGEKTVLGGLGWGQTGIYSWRPEGEKNNFFLVTLFPPCRRFPARNSAEEGCSLGGGKNHAK